MIIYIDNILVYLKISEEHAKDLKVFQILRLNKLYAIGDKYNWGKLQIRFLARAQVDARGGYGG